MNVSVGATCNVEIGDYRNTRGLFRSPIGPLFISGIYDYQEGSFFVKDSLLSSPPSSICVSFDENEALDGLLTFKFQFQRAFVMSRV